MGRTANADFSICRSATGRVYYRGLTPANGQSVEVDSVAPTASGWLVTAPDGTTYSISPSRMIITLTSGVTVSSRMVAYDGAAGRQGDATATAPVRRDANGFALGGPPSPTPPADYYHPSHSDCVNYRAELRAWSNYQNLHRPTGSTNDLPASGEVQYLWIFCHLKY